MKSCFSLIPAVALALVCLSSCSSQKKQEAAAEPTPVAKKTAPRSAAPTPAQQAKALEALAEQKAMETEEARLLNTPAQAEDAPVSELSTGGLRMRRFAPPEEAVSSAEGNDIPLPNAAELHGLRSPILKGGNLPMDINGKISPETQE